MKKVLSTVAALGLVAGLASTAAAVEFKMSGKYLVEGVYLSDARGLGMDVTETSVESTPSDAYWLHTFEMKPTMKVNDKVSMSAVIRLADDTFWGNQDDVSTAGSNVNTTASDIYVHHLYMDYASPIGKTRFGRVPTGTYGLNYMDSDTRGNRVMLWPSFLADGPWSTLFYIQKSTDNFANTTGGTTAGVNETDADTDVYVARLYYKTDSLDSGIHYGYTNNMTNNTQSTRTHQVIGYGKYKMDNLFLNAELTYNFGEVEQDVETAGVLMSRDVDSLAGMLQVGAKLDALTPSLTYFYAQGADPNATAANGGDYESALNLSGTTGTTGDQFEPLYILTGRHTGMLNNDVFTTNPNTAAMSTAGVHAVVAAADYAVSNQLSLHGAIGWAQADETAAGVDDEYGWEYNVGAAYKLLDNLTYEAHFGYLDTGDFFNAGGATDITENVYLMTHSLTMTF